jgi:hypothetical protein
MHDAQAAAAHPSAACTTAAAPAHILFTHVQQIHPQVVPTSAHDTLKPPSTAHSSFSNILCLLTSGNAATSTSPPFAMLAKRAPGTPLQRAAAKVL